MTPTTPVVFSEDQFAVACAKRLAGTYVAMDPGWVAAVAKHGVELAEDGAFTITLENGQVFHLAVTLRGEVR